MIRQMWYQLRAQQASRFVIVLGFLFLCVGALIAKGMGLDTEALYAIVMSVLSFALMIVLCAPFAWTLSRMAKMLYGPSGYLPMLEPVPAARKLGASMLLSLFDAVAIGGACIVAFVALAMYLGNETSSIGNIGGGSPLFTTITGLVMVLAHVACLSCAAHALVLLVNRAWPTLRKYGWAWLIVGGAFLYLYSAFTSIPYALFGAPVRFEGLVLVGTKILGDAQILPAMWINAAMCVALGAGLFAFSAHTLERHVSVG